MILPHGRTNLPRGKTTLPHGRMTLPHGRMTGPHGRTGLPRGRMSRRHRRMTLPCGRMGLPCDRRALPDDRRPPPRGRPPGQGYSRGAIAPLPASAVRSARSSTRKSAQPRWRGVRQRGVELGTRRERGLLGPRARLPAPTAGNRRAGERARYLSIRCFSERMTRAPDDLLGFSPLRRGSLYPWIRRLGLWDRTLTCKGREVPAFSFGNNFPRNDSKSRYPFPFHPPA